MLKVIQNSWLSLPLGPCGPGGPCGPSGPSDPGCPGKPDTETKTTDSNSVPIGTFNHHSGTRMTVKEWSVYLLVITTKCDWKIWKIFIKCSSIKLNSCLYSDEQKGKAQIRSILFLRLLAISKIWIPFIYSFLLHETFTYQHLVPLDFLEDRVDLVHLKQSVHDISDSICRSKQYVSMAWFQFFTLESLESSVT